MADASDEHPITDAEHHPAAAELDQSWWAAAAAGMGDEADLGQPELWFSNLLASAKEAPAGSLQQRALEAMAVASSAMLAADNWSAPFTPAMQWEGRRSHLPEDLTDEQKELLSRVAPLVSHTTLRARLADVCWTYGDRSRTDLLHLAVDGYCAVPLDADTWFTVGEESWTRALDLILRRGPAERDRARTMTESLAARLLTTSTSDAFMTVKLSELLRGLRSRSRPDAAEVSAHLSTLAAQVSGRNRRLSRHLDDEARAWSLLAQDPDTAWVAQTRIAESYVAEATERLSGDDSGAFVAGTLYEQAIGRLLQVPRARRSSTGLDERLDELRRELNQVRRVSLEAMTTIESEPVDLSTAAQQARASVTGHELLDALAHYSRLLPLTDVAAATAAAQKQVSQSLSHLFTRVTLSGDGRKVAAGGGIDDAERNVDSTLIRDFGVRVELSVAGILIPALEVLQTELGSHGMSCNRSASTPRRCQLRMPISGLEVSDTAWTATSRRPSGC